MRWPVALTIAGSDSSGAAGLQADLPTFAACGVRSATAVTVLTAQDGSTIEMLEAVTPTMVEAQLVAAISRSPAATKTGLLGGPDVIAQVARHAARGVLPNLVVDPVLVDATNRRLGSVTAVPAYRRLLGYAAVATPNRRELALLLDRTIDTLDDVLDAHQAIAALGPATTVVTGGRDGGAEVSDVVIRGDAIDVVTLPRLEPSKARGTGCTFSAAICAGLATGLAPMVAITRARRLVREQIRLLGTSPPAPGRPGLVHFHGDQLVP